MHHQMNLNISYLHVVLDQARPFSDDEQKLTSDKSSRIKPFDLLTQCITIIFCLKEFRLCCSLKTAHSFVLSLSLFLDRIIIILSLSCRLFLSFFLSLSLYKSVAVFFSLALFLLYSISLFNQTSVASPCWVKLIKCESSKRKLSRSVENQMLCTLE